MMKAKQQVNLSLFVDYKDSLKLIRNYLAGQFIGATRDETLLKEVVKCLFCKLHIKSKSVKSPMDNLEISKLYRQTFAEIRNLLPSIFSTQEELLLDPKSIAFIDEQFNNLQLNEWSRDPIGDVYEVFIGSSIRGQEGQFFTPLNAVELLISIISPQPGETIIDPACGAGGFLSSAARHLLSLGVTPQELSKYIFGIDKDQYLVKLASTRLSMVTFNNVNICCADSLAWTVESPLKERLGTFDIVLANPPFGSRIVAASPQAQASFDLGYKWTINKKNGEFDKTSELLPSVPPQVLFVERCLSLVRPGGRIGLIVPESLISSKIYSYVVNYIRQNAHLQAVIGMPESLFKTSGKSGTHTKTCLLVMQKLSEKVSIQKPHTLFMAEAKWCGHDSRGRQSGIDELPEIAEKYQQYTKGKLKEHSHLSYEVSLGQISANILAPRYYNPDVNEELISLKTTHNLIKLGNLIASGIIEKTTGDEVGKLAYGAGNIPFVRTSDISNWEIKVDPKQGVSEEVFQSLTRKQDVREGDILMVKDGTYLIGTCAFVTKYDTKIVFQSHLYKLRVTDPTKFSPYILLAALSSAPVRKQIKAKCFTQDIIDSLGNRILELILPIPKDEALVERITQIVKKSIEDRIEARELARKACIELIGTEKDFADCDDIYL